ncbi:MAG: KdsC family phosphatase [Pseudohongiellaceae bacterium]|jgi:3-deoxy-D-manno-octulosonate 8-phosphate phosphatase (KDO 8-P phosphatase)
MLFNQPQNEVETAARDITMLLLDVDGVLTDGKLYFSNSGDEIKAFSTLDGHGIKMLMRSGVEVGIITGRTSQLLSKRANDLGITLMYQGREDKHKVLADIVRDTGTPLPAIAYAGDDFPDLPVLRQVGLAFSVPAGHPDVRASVQAVTVARGGEGAVREIADFILRCQDKYQQHLDWT